MDSDRTYRDVRALSRGVTILEALAKRGWMKPAMLSAATHIDRATTYRLVETLIALGYVTRRSEDGAVAMTRKVKAIAAGVRNDDLVLTIVGRHLAELVREIKWPSDFARLANGRITIEESTHYLSPVTFHRAMIGQECSMLRSSLGQAILSMLTPDEIATIANLAGKAGASEKVDSDLQHVADDARQQIRQLGYASAIGAFDPKVSAIALPFRTYESVGSVNIVFFRKAMTPEEAASRFLGHLRKCVADIVLDISSRREHARETPGDSFCLIQGDATAEVVTPAKAGVQGRRPSSRPGFPLSRE
jgi:IclR family mhp operon transcriptional activator